MKTWVCNVAAMIGLALCSLTAFSQDGFEKYFKALDYTLKLLL